jgi:hypothetical protein
MWGALSDERAGQSFTITVGPRQRNYFRTKFRGTITTNVQLENKIIGHESQGACRQDELTGGKLPVVKYL